MQNATSRNPPIAAASKASGHILCAYFYLVSKCGCSLLKSNMKTATKGMKFGRKIVRHHSIAITDVMASALEELRADDGSLLHYSKDVDFLYPLLEGAILAYADWSRENPGHHERSQCVWPPHFELVPYRKGDPLSVRRNQAWSVELDAINAVIADAEREDGH